MTTDKIIELVIAVCPSVMALFTMVGVVLRVLHDFKALKREVLDMKDVEELKISMQHILRENFELKQKLNETLTKIDHINRK